EIDELSGLARERSAGHLGSPSRDTTDQLAEIVDHHRPDCRAITIDLFGLARDEQKIADRRQFGLLEAESQVRGSADDALVERQGGVEVGDEQPGVRLQDLHAPNATVKRPTAAV